MEENKATETPTIAPATVVPTTTTETEDMEARFKKLEEEKENYRQAYLKTDEKLKNKSQVHLDEDEDEKINRKVQEAIANSRLVDIAREQDEIVQRTLKRNKELELALLNKTTTAPSAALGTHSESSTVRDTLVTPEQEAFFKAKGWGPEDVEKYKKNLQKNPR